MIRICTATLAVLCLPAAGQKRPTGQAQRHGAYFTNFLVHASWPARQALKVKRVDNALVGPEVEELVGVLRRTLTLSYLPTAQQLQSLVACTNLFDSDDYLLLRYLAADQTRIEIQFGPALYLAVVPAASRGHREIAQYAEQTAREVLSVPHYRNQTLARISVWVSSVHLDNWKIGTLSYGESAPSPPSGMWYSEARWGSNGKRVLFEILRRDNPGLPSTAAAPRGSGRPERFLFRR